MINKTYENESGQKVIKAFASQAAINAFDAAAAGLTLCDDYALPGETIEACRSNKLAEMRKECGERIVAGFNSDALGYECQYRNTEKDQLAMQKAAFLNGGEIWRNETLTLHTKAQALIVYTESSGEIDMHKTTYANKCIYIEDPSRTAEEILAVTWDSAE